ncbi:protein of unknown function [Thermomonospora echinospora]|uniref:DUF4307 domain-containing protein n=1 Tax=Thermomonospora echinospora TaxID=1992 RepID=A0A1H6AAU0_9ACTN|nr:DUF4307 domain-containing protein [Thermomonospora echinospora]SEG45863.1 protein of unknown function [Thermomonospora echinospora]
MSTSVSQAPDRRPRRGGRLGYVIIGLVVAVCAVGWAVIMANAGRTPGISQQTITYRILDDSRVEVRWQVAKPSGKRVRCLVDAVDVNFAPVAEREVIVPAGQSTLKRTDLLQTTRRATAARVKECRTM